VSEEKNLEGIRGWLILVAIAMVVSPIRFAAVVKTTYVELFSTGTWEILTTQGSEAYDPLLASIIVAELLITAGLTLIFVYIAFMFFSKHRHFPKWFIGVAVFNLVWVIADALLIKLVLPNVPVFDPDTLKTLGNAAFWVVVWVPYMLESKRVKATFIK
jgi:hypothetical protein